MKTPGAVIVERDDGNLNALIALIVVLPIVVGIIAFVGGYYLSKRRYTSSSTRHLEQELTNKCKDDKCDAYQTLPKQTNLQLMNNHLTGKCPNAETTSIGERTLTRQKQVYV